MSCSGYRGRNIGRLMRFLYRMTTHSDYWIFDSTGVYRDGKCEKKIADYTWDGDSDVPTFTFVEGDYHWLNERQNRVKQEVLEDEAFAQRQPYKYAECVTDPKHLPYDANVNGKCPACEESEKFRAMLRESVKNGTL